MIKNENQYEAALKQHRGLIEKTIPEWKEKKDKDVSSKMNYDIFVGKAEEIKQEINEYEDLISGKTKTIEIKSIADFPEAIVKYRIMNNISYKELAKRTGISEKDIIFYEVEHASDCYGKLPLERVVQIIDAIGGDVSIKLGKKK